jgi:hypothetical protein
VLVTLSRNLKAVTRDRWRRRAAVTPITDSGGSKEVDGPDSAGSGAAAARLEADLEGILAEN